MQEWTISDLHSAYKNGSTDPVTVCAEYLARIDELDRNGPAINSIIEINPDALAIAEERAEELRRGAQQGLLHGVPVLLKDNIDTGGRMHTTAGSLALVDAPPPEDAFLVARLRAEGAVILGKTNLSEWANFRSSKSNSGWSSRGGQTLNPYATDRTPCGSSSGSGAAIAANFAVVAVGTETDGSVTCPAANCSIVGLKPSLGTVSRTGIIPIAASQDTAGPMARTVRDAAILLQALAGHDPADIASFPPADYLAYLDGESLRGARIGVARKRAGFHRGVDAPFEAALKAISAAGAEIVDPANLPELEAVEQHELTVLLYEFKYGLAEYFRRRNRTAPGARIASIHDLIVFNSENAESVLTHFGQELFVKAAECGDLTDEKYVHALGECRSGAGRAVIDAALTTRRLDAIVAPTNGPAWLIDHVNGDYYTGGAMSSGPAISGCPHVTVPMAYYRGLPLGISFLGKFGDDAKLLGIAHGYERATRTRVPPTFRAHALREV
ncbi:MAG: amidase [Spirochaetaceae bacterium]|nr:MAG: amidase [Spirochaetaceae bacterium]